MAFTTNLATDIGKVRLLLADMDSANAIFPDDAQIQGFLDIEIGDIKQATALAMESIASSRMLTMQMVKILDLQVDGITIAKSLLVAAEQLRKYANDDWSGFDFAEVTDNSMFDLREKFYKLLMAGSA